MTFYILKEKGKKFSKFNFLSILNWTPNYCPQVVTGQEANREITVEQGSVCCHLTALGASVSPTGSLCSRPFVAGGPGMCPLGPSAGGWVRPSWVSTLAPLPPADLPCLPPPASGVPSALPSFSTASHLAPLPPVSCFASFPSSLLSFYSFYPIWPPPLASFLASGAFDVSQLPLMTCGYLAALVTLDGSAGPGWGLGASGGEPIAGNCLGLPRSPPTLSPREP